AIVKDDVGRQALFCGAFAPPGAQSLKQGGIRCFHPRTFTAVTLARASRPPGCLPSGRHLPHRDAPLAAINGSDPGSLTQAEQGSPVIGVLAQQALELQLVQQVAPACGAVLASDAERRDLGLRSRSILGLTQQVVDDPAATEPAAQAMHGRERL